MSIDSATECAATPLDPHATNLLKSTGAVASALAAGALPRRARPSPRRRYCGARRSTSST